MKRYYLIAGFFMVAALMASYWTDIQNGYVELQKNNTNLPYIIDMEAGNGLPDFAQKTVRVEEAYIFAMENQELVMYISCYCGCANMQHSDNLIEHKSLKECYIKPGGSFEPHASSCKLCNDITLEVKELIGQDYSLKESRIIIDEKYSGRGVGTDTPLPP